MMTRATISLRPPKTRHVSAIVALCAMVTVGPTPARADGQRDLDDGIAFYENLDSDRAIARLTAASTAGDLASPARARASLYLGIVHFEVGHEAEAERAWRGAFLLDASVAVPAGISPKVVAALERVRRDAIQAVRPIPDPQSPVAPPGAVSSNPTDAPSASPVLVVPASQNQEDDGTSSGGVNWLLWGGLGTAVVAGAVVAIVVLTGGGSCPGEKGCLVVSIQ